MSILYIDVSRYVPYNYVSSGGEGVKPRPHTSQRKGLPDMAISESQRRAVRKYNDNAYDRIELKVSKGKKVTLQAHAATKGESLNGFVNRAIDEAVERDSLSVAGGVE